MNDELHTAHSSSTWVFSHKMGSWRSLVRNVLFQCCFNWRFFICRWPDELSSPHFASKCPDDRCRQNYPRSLLIPWSRGDLTPVSAVQIFSAPGAWPRSRDSKQDFSAPQLSVGRCWCCRDLCVCFGNGSDVNTDLNRNKKPVAEIPWGNQTNVQAPRSITSLGWWYSISLCLGVILNAASCLWFGS